MSDTLAPRKSKNTRNASQPTTPELLLMLQATLNQLAAQPGIQVEQMTVYFGCGKVAAIAITGCVWDETGNLVVAPAANTGMVE